MVRSLYSLLMESPVFCFIDRAHLVTTAWKTPPTILVPRALWGTFVPKVLAPPPSTRVLKVPTITRLARVSRLIVYPATRVIIAMSRAVHTPQERVTPDGTAHEGRGHPPRQIMPMRHWRILVCVRRRLIALEENVPQGSIAPEAPVLHCPVLQVSEKKQQLSIMASDWLAAQLLQHLYRWSLGNGEVISPHTLW